MWSDNETTQDLLGYQVHADLLQNIILNDAMLPISIGVFGNWGSGKSSLMLLLQKGIEAWKQRIKETNDELPEGAPYENNKVLQVRFNSWQFESYDSTKLTMIESILEALTKDIKDHKDCFEKVDDFFARIKFLKAGVFILKKVYENLTPDYIKKWFPTEAELAKITGSDEYNNLMDDISNGNTAKFVAKFRQLFEDLITDAKYKAVIVYIDDLDRCDPKRIIEYLEAVKLFANVNRTAFVIGADERIIEYAIKLHYPIEQKKEEISSPFSDYLEKLIQLPYKLPKLSSNEQETYITLLLCKNNFSEIVFNRIHNHYVEFRKQDKHSKYNITHIKASSSSIDFDCVEYMLPIVPLINQFLNGNPRQLKRFMNTLYVRKELARVAGFEEIRPDILAKLMVLEYNTLYSSRFEELYKLQRDNAGVLPIADVEKQAKTAEGIQEPGWKDNWSSEYLTRWINSQPSLADVNLQNYFWIARDALKNETPIASFVTTKVSLVFKRLCAIQLNRILVKELPDSIKGFDDGEKDMIVYLINEKLRQQPDVPDCWRILNSDESNLLLEKNIDRLKLLFDNVKTAAIDPQAATFFVRMLNEDGEVRQYMKTLSISKALSNSINLKLKKK